MSLCGHAELLTLIERVCLAPRSAYAFFGPEHIGKRLLAEHMARRLLNHPEPLPLEGHPDIALFDAQVTTGIEEVRGFLERTHRTAARGGRRVFLIDHAEHLNLAGFNALLKDVEEPRSGVTFIFISALPEALPATLRSRLVPFMVKEVPLSIMSAWATTELTVSPTWVQEAYGRPGLLKRRLDDPEAWEQVQHHVQHVQQAFAQPEPGTLVAALDDWQKTVDAQDHPEQTWHLFLFLLMRQAATSPSSHEWMKVLPVVWRAVGGPLPPRLAFEAKRLNRQRLSSDVPHVVADWLR